MIGIIGAMDEEILELKKIINIHEERSILGVTFYIGDLNSKEVVLVKSKIGKVASSYVTTLLVNNFELDYLKKWDNEFDEITEYPGDTIAYTNNKGYLVIVDAVPFEQSIKNKYIYQDDVDFLTVKEYANKHEKSEEQIKVFCRNGRIIGAKKMGRDWIIPTDAPYPRDRRIKS